MPLLRFWCRATVLATLHICRTANSRGSCWPDCSTSTAHPPEFVSQSLIMLPTFPAGLAPAAGQLNLAAAAGDPSTAADRWPSPEAAQVMPADAAPAGGSLAQHQSKPQQHTPAQAVAHTSAAAAAGTADPAASTAILQTSSAQQSSPHAALPGQLSAQPRPGPAPAEAAAMQHQQLATGVLPAPDQRVTSDNSSSGGAGAASAPPAAGNLSAQTATAGAADRPAATCPDAQAAATWRTAAAGMTLPAPAAAPESGLISALAAIIRQQDLKQQQQGLSTGAADAGATSVPARMGFRAPAVAVTPVGGSLQGSRSSSQPLASPADLLNLLLGLGRGTAMPQAVAPAPAALAAADALSGGGTAAWPQQQGQQMMSSLPGSAQGTFPAAFTAAPGLPGASSARREAGPPSSLAVAAALAALGPASVPRAAPAAAAAAAAGLSAARPMGAHALMKRKASGSLPSSPVVLSTYNSPRGLAGSSADAAGGASGCAGEVGSGVLRGQMPGMQLPPHPRGCFSGSAYEAGSGPAAAVIAASTAAGASGGAGARRTGAVSSALHEPQAWTGLAAAAAGAGGIGLRGFPTRATREAEAEGREEGDLNDLLLQATAAALHAAKAPTGSRGGVGNLAGKGRVEELQVAAAADGGEDMEVDVSPTMAAAAAAMSGLARLGSSGLGGESAAGRLRSKAAAASAAAAAALGGTASAKKKAAAHSRKAMQVDAGSSGGASGGGAAGGIMGAHQDPSVADAAAAAAALTAVAAAGMLAGSLNWGRQWYDGSSNQSAAAAAGEGGGDAGGLFAGSGYSWGGLMPGETGSWLQDNLVGTVPWPAQLAAGQQVVHKSRGQSAGGKAAGETCGRWARPSTAFALSCWQYVPRSIRTGGVRSCAALAHTRCVLDLC